MALKASQVGYPCFESHPKLIVNFIDLSKPNNKSVFSAYQDKINSEKLRSEKQKKSR